MILNDCRNLPQQPNARQLSPVQPLVNRGVIHPSLGDPLGELRLVIIPRLAQGFNRSFVIVHADNKAQVDFMRKKII